MTQAVELSESTWSLIDAATGRRFAAGTGCFLFAAAAQEALRGRSPAFMAGGAHPPGTSVMGWGLLINSRDGAMTVTADEAVDVDGTFCGHCWVEVPDWEPIVVDAMTGYIGPRVSRVAGEQVAYAPRAGLATAIRRHHDEDMKLVRRAVRANAGYRRLVTAELERRIAEIAVYAGE